MDDTHAGDAGTPAATGTATILPPAWRTSGMPDAWALFRAAGAAAIRDLEVTVQLNRMAQEAMNSGDLDRMSAARDLLSECLSGRNRKSPTTARNRT